jgi:hypothetical protein
LAECINTARHVGQPFANVLQKLLLGLVRIGPLPVGLQHQERVGLTGRHRIGRRIVGPGACEHALHLRDAREGGIELALDAHGFLDADPRNAIDENDDIAFIELRDELCTHARGETGAHRHERQRRADDDPPRG